MITIDFSKQQARRDADTKTIQQISYTAKADRAE